MSRGFHRRGGLSELPEIFRRTVHVANILIVRHVNVCAGMARVLDFCQKKPKKFRRVPAHGFV